VCEGSAGAERAFLPTLDATSSPAPPGCDRGKLDPFVREQHAFGEPWQTCNPEEPGRRVAPPTQGKYTQRHQTTLRDVVLNF